MTTSSRRRVSRETRHLLLTAFVALVALWVLARIRFPDQPATPSPIPSLLSQLSAAPRFANLAGEIAELRTRLSGSLLSILISDGSENAGRVTPAIRFRNDAALLILRRGDRLLRQDDVLTTDAATGLTVIRTAIDQTSPVLAPWVPSTLDTPRYFMATVSTPGTVSLRPVLVGALHEIGSPAWPGPIWSMPEGTDAAPGAFVFTTAGELAGLVIDEPNGIAIVPWDVAVDEATRLLDQPHGSTQEPGIDVQPLTPALMQATGSQSGVVVAWVDPGGPAANRLAVGDVIEALNTQPIPFPRAWEVATRRLPPGRASLRVRRRGAVIDLELALAAPQGPAPPVLGLRLRDTPGIGTTVVRVASGSAASAARLQEGDLITLAGGFRAPTASQVARAFQSARSGDAVMLAFTRGNAHMVTAMVK